jgi:adenine-specific DNA methylase
MLRRPVPPPRSTSGKEIVALLNRADLAGLASRIISRIRMSQARHLGIVNRNGREPSVAAKVAMHRKVVALQPFKTSRRIILGDARVMTAVKDESVHLIVTSPPYFDLVEYAKSDDPLGHLHNYSQFLDELGKVWAEAKREGP